MATIYQNSVEKFKLIADYIEAKKKNNVFNYIFNKSYKSHLFKNAVLNYMKKTGQIAIECEFENSSFGIVQISKGKLVKNVDGKIEKVSGKELFKAFKNEYWNICEEREDTKSKKLNNEFGRIQKQMRTGLNSLSKAFIATAFLGLITNSVVSDANIKQEPEEDSIISINQQESEITKQNSSEVKIQSIKMPVGISEIELTDDVRKTLGDDNFQSLKNALRSAETIDKVNKILYESGVINNKQGVRSMNSIAIAIYSAETDGGEYVKDSYAGAIGPKQLMKDYTVIDLYEKFNGKGCNTTEEKWNFVRSKIDDICINGNLESPEDKSFRGYASNFITALIMSQIKMDLTMDRIENAIDAKVYAPYIEEIKKVYPEECENNPYFIVIGTALGRYNGGFDKPENKGYRAETQQNYLATYNAQEQDYEVYITSENYIVYKSNGELIYSEKISNNDELDNNEIFNNEIREKLENTNQKLPEAAQENVEIGG